MKIHAFIPLLLLLGLSSARAKDFSSSFAVVMIDDVTEAASGPFPYDRSVMASAVEQCARAKAKSVVLKFFFDLTKSESGDRALADSMKRIPVVLQARLEQSEGTAAEIPERFRLAPHPLPTARSGKLGWIPLPALMDAAADLGFVDFTDANIPMVEEFRGAPYKSLVLCCLESALGVSAQIESGKRIVLGNRFLPLDQQNMSRGSLSRLEPLRLISFARLIAGEMNPDELEGRVVIIGYDGKNSPSLPTDHGEMKAHRLFIQCLAESYRRLQPLAPDAETSPAPSAIKTVPSRSSQQ